MKRKKRPHERKQPGGTWLGTTKVIGVGGGGSNAVSRMSRGFTRGVEFVAINTDHQDLDHCDVRHKVYIGKNLTKGLGTGMNPELGRQAAEENRSEIAEALRGADLVFLAAGLGGGTGTGASPIVAEVAKQQGALVFAFVTKPFSFEGTQRERIAQEGLMKLKDKVDALVVVPNDRIFTVINKDTPIGKAFDTIDDVLRSALLGIVELVVSPGIINVDFADVRTILEDAGSAIVGTGVATGPERAVNAVTMALHSPLLEVNPEGAKGVLLGISGGRDMRMNEVNEAAKVIAQTVDPAARIIFGAYYDRRLKPNQLKITLIATGFEGTQNASLFSSHFSLVKSELGGSPMSLGERMPLVFGEKDDKEKEKGEKKDAKAGEAPRTAGKQEKPGSKKEESDAWDIPTFLRRRKR